jgi:hypothetical protein
MGPEPALGRSSQGALSENAAMVDSKPPQLRVIQGGRQGEGESPKPVDELREARIKASQRRQPGLAEMGLAEIDLVNADTAPPSEPSPPKPASPIETGRSAALALLQDRIASLRRERPGVEIDPDHLDRLPKDLRDTLFARPLVRMDDGSVAFRNDPPA